MAEEKAVSKKCPDLVALIAVYHFVVAALIFLGVCALVIGLIAVLVSAPHQHALIGAIAITGVMVIMGLLLIANVVVGWGLLALKGWARWMAIVMGLLSLPNIPIGTLVGIFTLWYLLSEEGKAAFGVTN